MKAVVEQTLDSTWANAVRVRLEAELDNAHSLTTREIGTLMVHTMRIFIDEVRAENERAIFDRPSDDRERTRYQEMLRERDPREGERATPDNVRGEKESRG